MINLINEKYDHYVVGSDQVWNDELNEKEAAEPFNPSRNHQRQMRDMLKDPNKWLRNKIKPVWKVAVQRVAVVLLIASLGLGSVMAVSPTVRAAVIQWVTEWYETHITFRYAGDSDSDNLLNYEILGLPEGYSEVKEDRIEDDGYIQKKYRNFYNHSQIQISNSYCFGILLSYAHSNWHRSNKLDYQFFGFDEPILLSRLQVERYYSLHSLFQYPLVGMCLCNLIL